MSIAAGGRSGAAAHGGEAPDLIELAHSGPVHFMGVCGAGMASLAELVAASGGSATGCDAQPGAVGDALRGLGVPVTQGHDAAHVSDAVAVVVTAAVAPDHPELLEARRRGIPVYKRAAALGALVNRGTVVAVAGTHGKTTTTAMTSAVLEEGGLEPTAFVGGKVPGWGSGLRRGADRVFVVEADEYDRSFLSLRPTIAVVTTLEADHLDVFGTLDAIEDAFLRFLEPVPADGLLVACTDDAGARRLLERFRGAPRLGYGLDRVASLRAVDAEVRGHGSRATVQRDGQVLGDLMLHVPGVHNLRNALAAVAVGLHLGVPFEVAAQALRRFQGVARRFQELGEVEGVLVVDDYAHHPTEVDATLAAARDAFPGRRLVAVFQPHLYSRTRDFAAGLGHALAEADAVWVTDVYPAREAPIPGITGELVARAAESAGAREVHYEPAVAELPGALRGALRRGDVCVMLGAGSITDAAHALVAQLRAEGAA